MNKILVFDVETNDMPRFNLAADDEKQARVLQIAACVVALGPGLPTIEKMSALIRPDGWGIAPGAFNAHGISFERAMEDGRPIADVLAEFDALNDLLVEGEDTISAYNIRFDLKLLRGERRRAGRPDRFGAYRDFDPMKVASGLCKVPPTPAMVRAGRGSQFKSPKLAEAYKILIGSDMPNAHDAAADVAATVAIMRVMHETGIDIRGSIDERSLLPKEYKNLSDQPTAVPRAGSATTTVEPF